MMPQSIEHALPEADEATRRAQLELLTALSTRMFDKATAYANVVILAGYAGIFAIWSFIRDQLPDGLELWVAFLTGFSLMIFALFEIVKMLVFSYFNLKQAGLVRAQMRAGEWQAALAGQEALEQRVSLRFMRFWIFSLFATIFPAIIAAGLLFYGIAVRIPLGAAKFW